MREPTSHEGTCEIVEVGGMRLRVSVRGKGPPLLLLNGIGASLELLDPFRAAMRATETIAVDMPGSGASPPTRLPVSLVALAHMTASVLDVLGFGAVDVLGVSWGGALAQELALRHAARVRRLVLAATTTGWPAIPGHPAALWGLARDAADHARWVTPASTRGYLWQLAALAGWSTFLRLPRLRAPTLVMAGDGDLVVPLVNAHILAARIPGARLRVVPRAGHFFLLTHAAELAPEIEAFLAQEAQG